MPDNLKQKALHGVWWSAMERGGAQAVQFVIGVVLARLLLPEQFGLIGMLSIFIMLSQVLLDSGFGRAIVQRKQLTPVDTSSVFYLNIVAGLALAGVLMLVAPAIGLFFEQPELVPLTRFMAISVAIGGFSVVQAALLTRELRYKALTLISVTSILVSGTLGITLAYRDFGVWALAWQQVSMMSMRTALLWLMIGWRPHWSFSLTSLREMFSYGSKLMASGLMYSGFQHVYRVVIGKVYAPAELGFYTRATSLQQTATLSINSIISRVAFPVFASIQDDYVRLKRGMRRMLRSLALVNTPVMLGLLVVAKPLVIVLLTEKWLPSVPLFQVLCLAGVLYPLHLVNVQFLTATGRSGLNLKITTAKNAIKLVALAGTCPFGILAIVWGQFGCSVISYFINSYYTARLLGYSFRDQLLDVAPSFFAGGFMAVCTFPLAYIPGLQPWMLLLLQAATGAIVFFGMCRLMRLEAFEELYREARVKAKSLAASPRV